MSAVPTKTPVPKDVMRRNCRGVRAKERGRMPAANELQEISMHCSRPWDLVYIV